VRLIIDLDEELVAEGLKLSNVKTKKNLVALALKEFVENRKRLNLMDLAGKVRFADGYDYKVMREGRRSRGHQRLTRGSHR
jgi:Arc/MetJ family transcription regulator